MEKTKREPIKVLEDKKIIIENIDVFLSATIYEPWVKINKETGEVLPQKAHERVGFAVVVIGKVVELKNISVFLNTEKNEYWLAFPNKLVKGKFVGINYIPKDTSEKLNELLNDKQLPEQQETQENDVPWETNL